MEIKTLILKCQQGDILAQKCLLLELNAITYNVCRRYSKTDYESEEIRIEGFRLILKSLLKFKYINDAAFMGWTKEILIKQCIKHSERSKSFLETCEELPEDSLVDMKVFASIELKDISKALTRLPAGYLTVFNMFEIDGYSHKEIASELKIEEATSRSQLAKAKTMLQRILKSKSNNMEEQQNKTLKERFDELNEIPEGCRDDFNEIWAALEPGLEEFNKTIAPTKPVIKPERRLNWVWAAAAALLFLVIGSITGMLWQSKQNKRLLEMVLQLRQETERQRQHDSIGLAATATGKESPGSGILITSDPKEGIAKQKGEQAAGNKTIVVATGTIKKQPAITTDTALVIKNDVPDKIVSPVAQPVQEIIAINEVPAAKNKLRMIHRNQPYSVATTPVQETVRGNMDLYAFNSRWGNVRVSMKKDL